MLQYTLFGLSSLWTITPCDFRCTDVLFQFGEVLKLLIISMGAHMLFVFFANINHSLSANCLVVDNARVMFCAVTL